MPSKTRNCPRGQRMIPSIGACRSPCGKGYRRSKTYPYTACRKIGSKKPCKYGTSGGKCLSKSASKKMNKAALVLQRSYRKKHKK